jgi:hypothetical protein
MSSAEDDAAYARGGANRPVEEAISRIDAAEQQMAAAARSMDETAFAASGLAVLQRHVASVVGTAQQVLYVALSGELPPAEDAPELPMDREALLRACRESLDSLYIHVREADPDAFLNCTWRHPRFGELDWRGWLAAIELELRDCARELEELHA